MSYVSYNIKGGILGLLANNIYGTFNRAIRCNLFELPGGIIKGFPLLSRSL